MTEDRQHVRAGELKKMNWSGALVNVILIQF